VSPIRYIVDSAGNCTAYLPDDDAPCGEQGEYQGDQVTARNNVDVLDNILTHVVQSGTATAANIGRPVAGKTGTSQDFGNAWFAGFVPQLATIVWEGYPVETVKADAGSLVDGRVVPKSGKISVVPRMQYCADVRVCRPVHGYEVTGGGAPVSPAVMWANYMREAVAELDPLPFPTPTDLPDKVLNSPAPPPVRPVPTATKTQEPKPDHSPRPTPTTHPSPTTEPSPTVIPTTPGDGNGHGHGGKGRRNRGSGGDP
jgi:membrane peptidoglycan carboxypeptidase